MMPVLFSCRGASAKPVESTQSCTGTVIFFSHVTQMVMMRLAVISPFAPTQMSLDALFVASLQLKPALESSVSLGMNAEFAVPGIHSSKKLVSTRGQLGLAMLTSAHTVTVLSLPQLSHTARSIYTMMLPQILTFCVPNTGVPSPFDSHSHVSAKMIFSDGIPSGPMVSTTPSQSLRKQAPEMPVYISRVRLSGSFTCAGLKIFLHLISIILLTVQPHGMAGVNLRHCTVFIP